MFLIWQDFLDGCVGKSLQIYSKTFLCPKVSVTMFLGRVHMVISQMGVCVEACCQRMRYTKTKGVVDGWF